MTRSAACAAGILLPNRSAKSSGCRGVRARPQGRPALVHGVENAAILLILGPPVGVVGIQAKVGSEGVTRLRDARLAPGGPSVEDLQGPMETFRRGPLGLRELLAGAVDCGVEVGQGIGMGCDRRQLVADGLIARHHVDEGAGVTRLVDFVPPGRKQAVAVLLPLTVRGEGGIFPLHLLGGDVVAEGGPPGVEGVDLARRARIGPPGSPVGVSDGWVRVVLDGAEKVALKAGEDPGVVAVSVADCRVGAVAKGPLQIIQAFRGQLRRLAGGGVPGCPSRGGILIEGGMDGLAGR